MKSLLIILPLLALASCQSVNYQVTNNSDTALEVGETRLFSSEDVMPVADVKLPDQLGGGVVSVPINITPSK